MKNSKLVVSLFLCLLISGVTFYSGCIDKQTVIADYAIKDAEKIVDDFNSQQTIPHKKGEYHKARIEINLIDENMIDFSLKTIEGKYIHYVFQIANPIEEKVLSGIKERILDNAEILYFRRSIVINSLESDFRLYYSVDDKMIEPLAGTDFNYSLKGSGLIRQETHDYSQIITRATLHCKCCVWVVGQETQSAACIKQILDECDSGGSGSSSCSMSLGTESCTVECDGSTLGACCWDD